MPELARSDDAITCCFVDKQLDVKGTKVNYKNLSGGE
jgi:hypothetical protein